MTDEGSKAELTHNIALSYLNDVRERFNDQEKYAYFTQVFKDFSSRRIGIDCVIERVMKLFENHQDLLLGFNAFLPKDYAIILPKEDESAPVETPDRFQEAIEFINKIKARFKDNGHVYQTFLHILNMYGKKAKTVKEVNKEVIDLFGDHIDLIEEFGDYLPGLSGQAADDTPRPRRKHNSHRYYRSSAEHATGTRCVENTAASQDGWDYNVDEPGPDLNNFAKGNHRRMQKKSKKEMERRDTSKVRKRKLDDEDYDLSPIHKTALKVEDYVTDEFDQEAFWNNEHQPISVKVNGGDRDLYHEKRYKDRDPKNRDRERLDRVASGYKDESGSKTSLLFSSKDEAVVKPIQELDLSNCESCTPSYRLLPKNYPVPSVSHRTESDANVLNDNWVSVTSGSEDYSFKHMRKNQYEESLFRCEDDRYELDMLIESAKAARRNVKDWLSKIKDNTRETSSMNIEHHLTASNLRCIERVYGDHGLDVMDSLRNNPLYSMKVVSRRLKQKVKEWTKCRSDSSEVWAEVYAKNHHRSLDHRSFYFKLQDSKNLSSKALLAEIKEISKDQEKEDDVLFSFVTGTRQPVIPNLEFQLPDYDIHFYVYRLIEIASQYMCTAERFGRVLKVYTTLLEPMLGGSSHLKRADTEGDSIKSNSVTHCAGETDGSPVGVAATHSIRQSVVANGPLGHSNSSSWLVSNNGGSGIDNIPNPDHILLNCDTKYEVDPHLEKVQINANQMDETVGQPDCSSILATAVKDNYGRVYEVDKPGFFATMEYSKDAVNGQLLENLPLSAEGGECSKVSSDLIEAMTESINGHKCDEESRGQFAIEREEGELSPYGDDEDHILQAHGEADEKPEDSATSMHRETKSEENEVENDVDDDDDKDGMHLKAVKPLAMHAPLLLHYKEKEKSSQIFYGSDSFYLLFRLYQTLYDRIKSMKSSAERQCRVSNDTNPSNLCSSFLNAFCQLLDGSSDNTEFEDNCRTLIGAESYVLFTLDKLVKKLVNQLETIATSDLDNKLLQLYAYEKSRGGGFVDILYQNNARVLLQDDEYMFRIECSYEPLRLSMQLMDYGYNKPGQYALCMDQKVASYMYNYLLLSEEQERGVVLKRNKPKFARGDELYDTNQAMEGLQIYNGLECRIMVPSLRVGYVLGTEDFLYRKKKKTIHCNGNSGDQCNGKKVRGLDRLLMMSCLEE